MKFKEKIDKILLVNKLGINSISALEDEVGAGRGAINGFYNDNKEPGRKTLKRIMTLKNLNPNWYNDGKGHVFLSESDVEDVDNEDNKKETGLEEISLLIKSLDRMGNFNEHLLERVKELEKQLDQCLNK